MIATLPPFIESLMRLTGYDEISFWIVLTAALVNVSCAVLGCFLVLRRMSLLGDAISHAILPGLVLGFIVTAALRTGPTGPGGREHIPMPYFAMLVGALAIGVITALLTEIVHRYAKVPEDAAMGVVFTSLFAIGVIMIHRLARNVDLDPGCVLYGMLETAALDTVEVFGYEFSRPAANMAVVCAAVIAFVALLWKELKIVSFDPQLATAQGINAQLVHYLLMAMVATVTVAAFEAVGSILVVAMLIAPAAAAYMLTDRLSSMVILSGTMGLISAVLGRDLAQGNSLSARAVCAVLSFFFSIGSSVWHSLSTLSLQIDYVPVQYARASVSGMGAVVAGALFVAAVLFSPSHGLLVKMMRQFNLTLRIVREDALALLYRWQEIAPDRSLEHAQAAAALGGGWFPRLALWWLQREGRIQAWATADGKRGLRLTDKGARQAQTLVKSHRLWESYLSQVLGFPADHLHAPADRTEHYISEGLLREVAREVEHPHEDPHGRPIPRREGSRVDLGEKDLQ
ncbi:MAG TPA: metal ABC transporter permease [Planctomycetota bacterium]|nr:metal ABC transporter permease [Planctomycetota bacterium]